MVKSKKNLSLSQNIKEKAEKRAAELGFDFSGYITYLINLDLLKYVNIEGCINDYYKRNKDENATKKDNENKDHKIAGTLTEEIENSIDDILNGTI